MSRMHAIDLIRHVFDWVETRERRERFRMNYGF